jgi:hypothetical protein
MSQIPQGNLPMRIWIAFLGSPAPEIHCETGNPSAFWSYSQDSRPTCPFPPGHDDLSVLPLDLGGQIGRVRTGDPKLGHGERAPDLSIQEGQEVFLLLFRIGVTGEDFHVTRIWGRTVSRLGADERGVPHDLGHDGVLYQKGQIGQPIRNGLILL